MAGVWIGTSGFSYKHWANGVFYPAGLSPRKWLEFYGGCFSTVEMNVTFYRLPAEKTFEGWHGRTPPGFSFSIKGSRFITHVRRLKGVEEPLKLFFERTGALREKLGCVLWQLPPGLHLDTARLEEFLCFLKGHAPGAQVFEFRHESWFCDPVERLLEAYGAALCSADWRDLSVPEWHVGPCFYLRRHGPGRALYSDCYPDALLREDARRIRGWLREGKDVYVYFNNDVGGWAPRNARTLVKMLESAS